MTLNNSKEMQSEKLNILKWCAYISLGVGITLLICMIVLAVTKPQVLSLEKISDVFYRSMKDNPGEFIGGTIGTLFTLTATIFLFITFKEQRQQFESTQSSEFYTRFETTYFNMLGMLEKVQSSVNTNINESDDSDDFCNLTDYYKRFKSNHSLESIRIDEMKNIADSIKQDELIPADVLKARQYYGDYFEKYVKKAPCNIGYFYRYIYNIVNFVYYQTKFKEDNDKEHYLNLLQAQLSDEELALIFYDAISSYGENKTGEHKFQEMLDETHFFENIKAEALLDKNHCYFYPKTTFKFMSKDDKLKAASLRA